MILRFDNTFRRDLKRLTPQETKQTKAKIQLLRKDLRHPSLRLKKMKGDAGQRGIYRMRVSRSLRITFRIKGDTIFLRRVGGHDETIVNP